MRLSILVAMSPGGCIGLNGDLPWGRKYKDDLKHFKLTTAGHTLIMGRKTAESLPPKKDPLPGRTCVVVSSQLPETLTKLVGREFVIKSNLADAVEYAVAHDPSPFVIGGCSIYKQALDQGLVRTMYITYIAENYRGDTYFPEFNPCNWWHTTTHKSPGLSFSRLDWAKST